MRWDGVFGVSLYFNNNLIVRKWLAKMRSQLIQSALWSHVYSQLFISIDNRATRENKEVCDNLIEQLSSILLNEQENLIARLQVHFNRYGDYYYQWYHSCCMQIGTNAGSCTFRYNVSVFTPQIDGRLRWNQSSIILLWLNVRYTLITCTKWLTVFFLFFVAVGCIQSNLYWITRRCLNCQLSDDCGFSRWRTRRVNDVWTERNHRRRHGFLTVAFLNKSNWTSTVCIP